MYNMINIVKTTACSQMRVLKINPKSSHNKEKMFYYFFNFVATGEDGCSLNFLAALHGVRKSNHYAVHT